MTTDRSELAIEIVKLNADVKREPGKAPVCSLVRQKLPNQTW